MTGIRIEGPGTFGQALLALIIEEALTNAGFSVENCTTENPAKVMANREAIMKDLESKGLSRVRILQSYVPE